MKIPNCNNYDNKLLAFEDGYIKGYKKAKKKWKLKWYELFDELKDEKWASFLLRKKVKELNDQHPPL